MAEFIVKMRGTTYFGKPAGSGGDEIECSTVPGGDLSEEIRYWDLTQATGGFFSSLFGKRSGEIKRGYISQTSFNSLDELGIVMFKPTDEATMKSKPAASYALYRAK